MAPKWSNKNLPGALHFVTGSFADKRPVFNRANACQSFVDVCANLKQEWPFKLIAYVLMRDHIHLIVNPRDGRIRELMGKLKSLSAREIIAALPDQSFVKIQENSPSRRFRYGKRASKPFRYGANGSSVKRSTTFTSIRSKRVWSSAPLNTDGRALLHFILAGMIQWASTGTGGGQMMSRSWPWLLLSWMRI